MLFSCRFWCQRSEEKLSEIIASLLTSKYPSSSPNKRKRPLKGSSALNSTPSADQVYLDKIEKSIINSKLKKKISNIVI